ncbi:RagB/SusD family nutrient uptake outer membrane protein [Bacteroides sp. BFG-551]|nr:RagB/SusD family nutrient uptake outer membrane protein [Bacteroides sp. BFG-551]
MRATKNAPTAVDEWGNNIPILRYTDVKLMYAEALNEVDYATYLSTDILPIINDVRKRAGLSGKSASDFPDKKAVFDYPGQGTFCRILFRRYPLAGPYPMGFGGRSYGSAFCPERRRI